jgi:hypothetical protein
VVRCLDGLVELCSDVGCYSHKSITKTNWYEHSRNCEAYLALEPGVDGEPKIQNGRITQNAPARAGPSGLNRSRSLRNQNASVKEARAARRRKLPVRRPRTARSRKYKVDDDSENEEERQSKVYTFSLVLCIYSPSLTCAVFHSESSTTEPTFSRLSVISTLVPERIIHFVA